MVKSNKKNKKQPKTKKETTQKSTNQKLKQNKNKKNVVKTKRTKKQKKSGKNKKHEARLKLSRMVVEAVIEDGDQWEKWLDQNIYKKPENYQLWLDGEMDNASVVSLPDFLEEYEYNCEGDNDDDGY